jgi:hypothetical protein
VLLVGAGSQYATWNTNPGASQPGRAVGGGIQLLGRASTTAWLQKTPGAAAVLDRRDCLPGNRVCLWILRPALPTINGLNDFLVLLILVGGPLFYWLSLAIEVTCCTRLTGVNQQVGPINHPCGLPFITFASFTWHPVLLVILCYPSILSSPGDHQQPGPLQYPGRTPCHSFISYTTGDILLSHCPTTPFR